VHGHLEHQVRVAVGRNHLCDVEGRDVSILVDDQRGDDGILFASETTNDIVITLEESTEATRCGVFLGVCDGNLTLAGDDHVVADERNASSGNVKIHGTLFIWDICRLRGETHG